MFVFILPRKAIPEMTYTVAGGMLNPTHSLTHSLVFFLLNNVILAGFGHGVL